jgi:hypothetical protein
MDNGRRLSNNRAYASMKGTGKMKNDHSQPMVLRDNTGYGCAARRA